MSYVEQISLKRHLNQQQVLLSVDFDKAISLTGYGKFHYKIFIASAISILTVGFQNALSAYIFPAAQCELKLPTSHLGYLNVAFLFGGTMGSFLWGILADSKGRRLILVSGHLLNSIITLVCSIINFPIILLICRFFNGFLIGAPGSIIFTYLAEFQPPKYRSSTICYLGLSFTISWLILPLMAWLILPLKIDYQFNYFILNSWRLFLIFLSIPEVIVALWIFHLPESPKFLAAQGRLNESLLILKKIFSINTGQHSNQFPVKNLIFYSNTLEEINDISDKKLTNIKKIFKQIEKLFHTPLLFLTLLFCTIMFTNMFGTFGLGLWLPELFIRFEKYQNIYPNKSVTVKQLSSLVYVKNSTCNPLFDDNVIEATIAIGLSTLIGNILSGYCATKVPLKIILYVTMFMGGCSATSIYWLSSSLQNLIIASIFQSSMITANMVIGTLIVELFPTSTSAMAFNLAIGAGRIAAICSNLIFGLLIDKYCEIPIFIVSVTILIGALLCLIIPRKQC